VIGGKLTGMAAAALALCGVIAVEIAGREARPQAVFGRPASPTPARDAISLAEPPAEPDVRLKAILARPLFSPDRRPMPSAARSVSGLPRLTGIIVTEQRRFALFAAAGKTIIAEQGLRLGAYDVMAISVSGVTVAGPEGTTVLRPIFDPTPPPVAKPALTPRAELPKPPAKADGR